MILPATGSAPQIPTPTSSKTVDATSDLSLHMLFCIIAPQLQTRANPPSLSKSGNTTDNTLQRYFPAQGSLWKASSPPGWSRSLLISEPSFHTMEHGASCQTRRCSLASPLTFLKRSAKPMSTASPGMHPYRVQARGMADRRIITACIESADRTYTTKPRNHASSPQ